MKKLLDGLAREIQGKGKASKIRSLVENFVERDNFVQVHEPNIHPLGFIHTKLGMAEGDIELRLHIWPDSERPYQEPRLPLHDHIWQIDSHILTGEIENKIYNVEDTDNEPTHRIYEVSYDGEKEQSLLTPTNRLVQANLSRSTTFDTGEHYSVEQSRFHASRVPAEEFTATIVATSESEEKPPKVLGPINGDSQYTYDRRQCEPNNAKDYIDQLIEEIR